MKGNQGKSPSVQWYYKDWLSDRELQRASPTTRGVWMNLLMHMIDCSVDGKNCKEGMLEDVTITELMQLGSCDENAAWDFIDDALKHNFCNIELDKNRTFHIMSRRLARDHKNREYWRETKRLQRRDEAGKYDSPTNVQSMSARTPIPTPIPTPDIYTKKGVKKRVFIPPSLTDVISYFKEKGYSTEVGKRAFDGYNEADWHDSKGKPVLNWKQKMNHVWFKDENKSKEITYESAEK